MAITQEVKYTDQTRSSVFIILRITESLNLQCKEGNIFRNIAISEIYLSPEDFWQYKITAGVYHYVSIPYGIMLESCTRFLI